MPSLIQPWSRILLITVFCLLGVGTFADEKLATHALLKNTVPIEFDIRPGPGVTQQLWLGDIFPPICGTAADTPVYVLEGAHPEPVVFVAGGVHPTEPAGMLAALTLVERVQVDRGTLVVVPYANPLAIPPEQTVTFVVDNQEREFHHGDRRTLERFHPELEGSSFETPSGRKVSARETRNLNRIWPGRADGTPSDQLAYAITLLMKEKGAQIAFDLHEVRFQFDDKVWRLAGNTEYAELLEAASARLNQNIQLDLFRALPSDEHDGVSWKEWRASTGAMAFLTETCRSGATPMERRVGIQLESILSILGVIGEQDDALQTEFSFFPRKADILTVGPAEPPDRTGRRL